MYTMNKKTGIIISIIMVALGLFAFIDPFSLGVGLAYVVTIGLGIYGVSNIVTYFKTEPDSRNGWTLANGIILTVLAVLMLWTALGKDYGSIQMLSTLSFAIGFFTLIAGIDQIQAFNVLRKAEVPHHESVPDSAHPHQSAVRMVRTQRYMGTLPHRIRHNNLCRIVHR